MATIDKTVSTMLFRKINLVSFVAIAIASAAAVEKGDIVPSPGSAKSGTEDQAPGAKESGERTDPIKPNVGETIIKPPFGLAWKLEDEKLEQLLEGAKAIIVHRQKDGDREVWRVEGLVQTGLKVTLFEMKAGKLESLSLIYRREEWGEKDYVEFYGQAR